MSDNSNENGISSKEVTANKHRFCCPDCGTECVYIVFPIEAHSEKTALPIDIQCESCLHRYWYSRKKEKIYDNDNGAEIPYIHFQVIEKVQVLQLVPPMN